MPYVASDDRAAADKVGAVAFVDLVAVPRVAAVEEGLDHMVVGEAQNWHNSCPEGDMALFGDNDAAAVEGVGLRDHVAALACSDRGCKAVSQRGKGANMAVGKVPGSLGDAPDVREGARENAREGALEGALEGAHEGAHEGAAREDVVGMVAALAILLEPALASRSGSIPGIAASKGRCFAG